MNMLEIFHAEKTSTGKVRSVNEDSYGFLSSQDFFFVCDGMGGHAAGDFASRTAVDTIRETMESHAPEKKKLLQSLISARPALPLEIVNPVASIFLSNRRLFQCAVGHPVLRGMGTTIVSLFFTDSAVYTLHVGDSRAYRLRDAEFKQLTTDHSWVNELLEDKEISRDEALAFKKKNVVTRVLGTQQTAKIDCSKYPVKTNDCFLLCSDGLTGPLPDEQIRSILHNTLPDLKKGAAALIDAVHKAGAPDNVTVMLIMISKAQPGIRQKKLESTVETIDDNNPEYLEHEDHFIKKNFRNRSLPIPKEPSEIKSFKDHLPAYSLVTLLIIIFTVLSLSFYRNIDKRLHPEKYSLVATETYDPDRLTGYLEVVTEPSEAEIYLNDAETPVGLSPLIIPFTGLDPEGSNTHHITIKKNGYQDDTMSKEVIINDTITMTVSLIPESIIELYLGIDAHFPDDAHIAISSAGSPEEKKILTTINRLKNIAYQDGLPSGNYILTIIRDNNVLWKYQFKAYSKRKAKVYITQEKDVEIIQYEKF